MAKRLSLAESVKRAAVEKPAAIKVTFELEEPIYTKLRVFSANTRKSGREILTEALKDYLARNA